MLDKTKIKKLQKEMSEKDLKELERMQKAISQGKPIRPKNKYFEIRGDKIYLRDKEGNEREVKI